MSISQHSVVTQRSMAPKSPATSTMSTQETPLGQDKRSNKEEKKVTEKKSLVEDKCSGREDTVKKVAIDKQWTDPLAELDTLADKAAQERIQRESRRRYRGFMLRWPTAGNLPLVAQKNLYDQIEREHQRLRDLIKLEQKRASILGTKRPMSAAAKRVDFGDEPRSLRDTDDIMPTRRKGSIRLEVPKVAPTSLTQTESKKENIETPSKRKEPPAISKKREQELVEAEKMRILRSVHSKTKNIRDPHELEKKKTAILGRIGSKHVAVSSSSRASHKGKSTNVKARTEQKEEKKIKTEKKREKDRKIKKEKKAQEPEPKKKEQKPTTPVQMIEEKPEKQEEQINAEVEEGEDEEELEDMPPEYSVEEIVERLRNVDLDAQSKAPKWNPNAPLEELRARAYFDELRLMDHLLKNLAMLEETPEDKRTAVNRNIPRVSFVPTVECHEYNPENKSQQRHKTEPLATSEKDSTEPRDQ